jgi:hypothetical protein
VYTPEGAERKKEIFKVNKAEDTGSVPGTYW